MRTDTNTLVILSPGFPANEADTTCLPAQQQFVQNLQESFPQVRIIVLAFQYPFVRSTYQWKNVTVISLNGRNKGRLNRILLWYKAWRKLGEIDRTTNIVGLFSFWCTECALIGKRFGKRYGIPHYIWVLGQDARKPNRYVRRIRPNAESLVAMSESLATAFYQSFGIRPQHVIPNGIDPRLYQPQEIVRDIDVLGAGSLIPLKQYHMFINIVDEARKTIPGIRSVICGKGPLEAELKQQINELQLQQHVTLAGEKPHPEVLQLMQRAKVFLHTSYYEGFSTVCLEALYAGAHVISFHKPVSQPIPHWHHVSTHEDIMQKLLEILQDPAPDHQRVMPFTMKDSAKAVMKLFMK